MNGLSSGWENITHCGSLAEPLPVNSNKPKEVEMSKKLEKPNGGSVKVKPLVMRLAWKIYKDTGTYTFAIALKTAWECYKTA